MDCISKFWIFKPGFFIQSIIFYLFGTCTDYIVYGFIFKGRGLGSNFIKRVPSKDMS